MAGPNVSRFLAALSPRRRRERRELQAQAARIVAIREAAERQSRVDGIYRTLCS